MTNKKSTPGGAQFDGQTNNNTSKERMEAEMLFDRIGTGKSRAVHISHRDNSNVTARRFREMVADARKEGDPIINEADGSGYYRPDMNNDDEADAARHFCRSLMSRAKNLEQSAHGIADALGIEI